MFKILQYILVLFFSVSTLAQEAKMEKAEKLYENYGYINARDIYLKVAEKGFESEELFQRLGDSYYFNAAYSDALVWYKKLFALNEEQEEVYLIRYAQALQATGETKKAKKIYDLSQNENQLSSEDYSSLIEKNSGRYSIKELIGINTKGREFGHSFYEDKLIFAATRDTGVFIKRKSAWDGLTFLDLYEVEVKEDSTIGEPKKISGKINGKYHESSAVITANGESLYFTKTAEVRGKKSQNLNIYRAQLRNGEWTNIEKLSINSDGYSTAHPTLDKNEEYLYFASNKPGGFGESDIYKAALNKDGSLGTAENLGSKVNTPGKETFPFISDKNELYFSSDGHFGLGGLDIFYVKIENGEPGNILNIGEPVNSYADDFSFGIDPNTKKGFFSSNRKKDKSFGYDNIYTLKENKEIKDVYKAFVTGQVTTENAKPLTNATITLYKNGKLYDSLLTDEKGNYSVVVDYFKTYSVQASKENFDTKEKISEAGLASQQIDFSLRRNRLALIPGTDISNLLNIRYILFDFDKANIRKDAQIELEKLRTVMQQYPELKIEIRSHTDSRGSDVYNKTLSEKRAHSTRRYLIEKGIAEDRLTAKGFGEEMLLNKCGNTKRCSSEQHQKNRRSEFIVVE